MRASEVRTRILAEHDALRADLERVEALAVAVLRRPERRAGELRAAAQELVPRLVAHLRWEESHLLPALREAHALGAQRAARLVRDHRSQRELLRLVHARLCDPAHPAPLLASELRGLAAVLRADLGEEERDLRDERVLRDDAAVIGAGAS
jgi:hemerythrin HHE cation binding domain-containing protein